MIDIVGLSGSAVGVPGGAHLPIPQALRVFQEGRLLDARIKQQLHALGHALARAAQVFEV